MSLALVPVKALASSKSRLFADDERGAAEALALAMLADLLECLLAVPELDRVAVVTPDPRVAEFARNEGALALLRDDAGLDPAIENAVRELASPGEAVLVVLGDVAAAAPRDISALFAALEGSGVALAPSRDGGTSALLRLPASAIPTRFGPDSAKRHREEAMRAGVACVELALPSLAIDVDVRDDARAILACESCGRRTRALLEGGALADAPGSR
jgi:2-phospho-L-lactate/phosphoenolpyruvate guanylyltransferase